MQPCWVRSLIVWCGACFHLRYIAACNDRNVYTESSSLLPSISLKCSIGFTSVFWASSDNVMMPICYKKPIPAREQRYLALSSKNIGAVVRGWSSNWTAVLERMYLWFYPFKTPWSVMKFILHMTITTLQIWGIENMLLCKSCLKSHTRPSVCIIKQKTYLCQTKFLYSSVNGHCPILVLLFGGWALPSVGEG